VRTGLPLALAGAGAGLGIAALPQALPMISSIAPLRNRLMPDLAGIGAPGHVALTFDDGPDPASTPLFLRMLADEGVTATFFLLGRMLVKAPELAREMVAAGHEIALHGWEHRPMILRSPRETRDDLTRGYDLIGDVTSAAPTWYRPPYGVLTTAAYLSAARLGMRTVLWSAWGRDWTAHATPASVQRLVERDLTGGGTILLHDSDCTAKPQSWRSTLGAVPALLTTIRTRNLQVGPLKAHFAPAPPFSPALPTASIMNLSAQSTARIQGIQRPTNSMIVPESSIEVAA
jgi:peptidoglycan-N-acetylglucosamine deacetylase